VVLPSRLSFVIWSLFAGTTSEHVSLITQT